MSQAIRNQVQLIGQLGDDPVTKQLDGGKQVTNMRLATNHSFTNAQGEKVDHTDWHNIVLWNKTAEVAAKFLKRGSEVAIQGRLTTRSYKKDGQTRYVTEVVGAEMLLLGKREG